MSLSFSFLLQGPGTSEDLKNKQMVTAEKSYVQRRKATDTNKDCTRQVEEGTATRLNQSQPPSLKAG